MDDSAGAPKWRSIDNPVRLWSTFAEPMVCTPRDAVRVFYGSNLDLLVIDRFVLRK
jgi:hypothetical protein